MIDEEHFRSDDIKENMDDLETQWVELKDTAASRKDDLDQSLRAY